MGDANVLGALADGAVEDLGRRAMGVLREEVMLDLPDKVHTDTIGKFNLGQRFPVSVVLVFGLGRFHFVEQAELHRDSSVKQIAWSIAGDSPSFSAQLPTE